MVILKPVFVQQINLNNVQVYMYSKIKKYITYYVQSTDKNRRGGTNIKNLIIFLMLESHFRFLKLLLRHQKWFRKIIFEFNLLFKKDFQRNL